MKYGKTLLIAAMALCLHQAANANEAPANVLSAEDAGLAFGGGDKTLQVAALSAEEMEKTQGAYFYRLPYQALSYQYASTYIPRSYGGASQIGLSLIGASMNNTSYSSWSTNFTRLAYSKAGGFYRNGL